MHFEKYEVLIFMKVALTSITIERLTNVGQWREKALGAKNEHVI